MFSTSFEKNNRSTVYFSFRNVYTWRQSTSMWMWNAGWSPSNVRS